MLGLVFGSYKSVQVPLSLENDEIVDGSLTSRLERQDFFDVLGNQHVCRSTELIALTTWRGRNQTLHHRTNPIELTLRLSHP